MLSRSTIAGTKRREISIREWLRVVSTGFMWCSAVMLAIAVVILNMIIIKRAIGLSVLWEYELTVYLTIGAIFLAFPYTMRTGGHVAIDMISPLLPERIRAGYRCIIALSTLMICIYLTWQMGHLAFEAWASGERARTVWNPPIWPVYATAPLGLGLTALEIVCRMFASSDGKVGEEGSCG